MDQEKEIYIAYRNIVKEIIRHYNEDKWELPLDKMLYEYDKRVKSITTDTLVFDEMREELIKIAQRHRYVCDDEDGKYVNPELLRRHISNIIDKDRYCETIATTMLRRLSENGVEIKYEDLKNNVEGYIGEVDLSRYTKHTKANEINKYVMTGFSIIDEVIPFAIQYKIIVNEEERKNYIVPDIKQLTIKDVMKILML